MSKSFYSCQTPNLFVRSHIHFFQGCHVRDTIYMLKLITSRLIKNVKQECKLSGSSGKSTKLSELWTRREDGMDGSGLIGQLCWCEVSDFEDDGGIMLEGALLCCFP